MNLALIVTHGLLGAMASRALTPWEPPRLISIPLLLVLAGVTSFVLLRELEVLIRNRLITTGLSEAADLARQRTRSLASFLAINIFFWFADPTLGLFAGIGGQIVRSLVLVVSAMALARTWNRSAGTYRRESTSASLRKQLQPLLPQLREALDGRSLEELSPSEVFTLAKVLPAHLKHNNLNLYRQVLEDLWRSSRLDLATSLGQLEELRQALGLQEGDHHTVIRELTGSDPSLLQFLPHPTGALDREVVSAQVALADVFKSNGQRFDPRPNPESPIPPSEHRDVA
ncbi:MAG: hypothetical protein WBM08_01890 [Prochlorococcaceae cyanobacterium]